MYLCSGAELENNTKYTVKAIKGFLKKVANELSVNNNTIFKCWNSSTEYYNKFEKDNPSPFASFTEVCSEDSRYYQVCGHVSTTGSWNFNSSSDNPLCFHYICTYYGSNDAGDQVLESAHCNKDYTCKNEPANLRLCNSTINTNCTSGRKGKMVEKDKLCNGVQDCPSGTDELDCPHNIKLECKPKDMFTALRYSKIWVSPDKLCSNDTTSHCANDADKSEEICGRDQEVGSCKGSATEVSEEASEVSEERTFYKAQKCVPSDYSELTIGRVCYDGQDQVNCTNRDIHFNCTGKKTPHNVITLTDIVLCENLELCQDNINKKCERPEANCKLHRHFICDNTPHCENGLDEEHCTGMLTDVKCVRKVRDKTKAAKEHFILKSWVLDGVQDCENGYDEDPYRWSECKYKDYNNSAGMIEHVQKGQQCKIKLYCPSDETLMDPGYLCRSMDCTLGKTSICRLVRNRDTQNTLVKKNYDTETYRFMSMCLPGISNEGQCQKSVFEDSFGTIPTTIVFPINSKKTLQCKSLFGESYVYASCLGICMEIDITCPIREVNYLKTCPYMSDRNLTLTKRNTLTFVTEYKGGNLGSEVRFVNKEVFSCFNGKCLTSYAQVCDLNDDCGDNSDEVGCGNHFSCDKSTNEIISLSQVCDGIIDCSNGADECNSNCSTHNDKRIIKPVYLQVSAWICGILASVFNAIIIFQNSQKLAKRPGSNFNRIQFSITAFVTLVALGDFLMGIYQVSMSIENIVRSEDFCRKEMDWLASSSCQFYGVLSTIGSQLSIFALTAMSLYRAIVMKNPKPSSRPSRPFFIVTMTYVAVLIIAALLVAILPIIGPLEDIYFYNGYVISRIPDVTENTLFTFQPQKNLFYIELLTKYNYFQKNPDNITNISAIKSSINKMFKYPLENQDQNLNFTTLGFYGSSGSCTFKYFVDPKDPQRAFTWTILTLNLTCLVVVALSYLSVHAVSLKSASKVGGTKRFGRLQKKISLMILTDFLCMFPFIIVCLLHYLYVLDATPLYPMFSVLILPINSVLNPILYSDHLFNAFAKKAFTMATDAGHSMAHYVSERVIDKAHILPDIPEAIKEEDVTIHHNTTVL